MRSRREPQSIRFARAPCHHLSVTTATTFRGGFGFGGFGGGLPALSGAFAVPCFLRKKVVILWFGIQGSKVATTFVGALGTVGTETSSCADSALSPLAFDATTP